MPRKSNTTAPASFDPNALAMEDVAMPAQRRVVESRRWDNNPFVEHMRGLVGTDNGKMVRVPGYHVKDVASGVRDAAEKLTAEGVSTGARLVFEWTNDDGETVRRAAVQEVPQDERIVTVMYAARERRRSLTDDDREDAASYGDVFKTPAGKINGRKFLEWVAAGRPTDEDGWPTF